MSLPTKAQIADLGATVLNAAALEGLLASLAVILIGTDEAHAQRVMGNPNRSWLSGCIRRLLPTTLAPDLAEEVADWMSRADAHMEVRNRLIHSAVGQLEDPSGPLLTFGRTSKGEMTYDAVDFTGLNTWNSECGDLLVAGSDLWERMNAARPILGGGTRHQPVFERTRMGGPKHFELE